MVLDQVCNSKHAVVVGFMEEVLSFGYKAGSSQVLLSSFLARGEEVPWSF